MGLVHRPASPSRRLGSRSGFGRGRNHRQAHRRSAGHRLDHHRQPQSLRRVCSCGRVLGRRSVSPRRRSPHPVGRRHARVSEQALGDILVHGQSAPRRPAPSIRNAERLQHGLHRPVLPRAAVKRRKRHVRLPQRRFRRAQARKRIGRRGGPDSGPGPAPGPGGRVPAPAPRIPGFRTRRNAGGPDARLFLGRHDPRHRVHAHDLVPQIAQCRRDLATARQRHVAFLRRPAHQHGDPQAQPAPRGVRSLHRLSASVRAPTPAGGGLLLTAPPPSIAPSRNGSGCRPALRPNEREPHGLLA